MSIKHVNALRVENKQFFILYLVAHNVTTRLHRVWSYNCKYIFRSLYFYGSGIYETKPKTKNTFSNIIL